MSKRKKRYLKLHKRNYLYLPNQFWNAHDVCIGLLGQLEEVMLDDDYAELKVRTIPLNNEMIPEEMHILDFLLTTNQNEEHDMIVRDRLVTGLLTDICYFTQEAMSCSLKMRLPVCFALLRKPFVYALIIILRLLFEEKFIDRFNNEEGFDPASISPEDRLALLKGAVECMPIKVFQAEEINEWIFDKTYEESIINMSDMALHLTTKRNKHIVTEKQNFNFIFSQQEDILSQWELVYRRMPALILFLAQVSDILLVSAMDMSGELYNKRLLKRLMIMKNYKGQPEE